MQTWRLCSLIQCSSAHVFNMNVHEFKTNEAILTRLLDYILDFSLGMCWQNPVFIRYLFSSLTVVCSLAKVYYRRALRKPGIAAYWPFLASSKYPDASEPQNIWTNPGLLPKDLDFRMIPKFLHNLENFIIFEPFPTSRSFQHLGKYLKTKGGKSDLGSWWLHSAVI